MKKAQVSIEFLFVIATILLLAIFVLYDVSNKKIQVKNTEEFLLKKNLCLEFSSFISGVYTKGMGTEAYLELMGNQLSYPVTVQPIARNIFVGDKKAVYCTIPISSVSNSTDEIDWFRFNFSVDYRYLKFENVGNLVVISLVEGFP